ncbi:MAG: nucleotide exchange factor GrpE [Gemmatimonadaceae bacterium]
MTAPNDRTTEQNDELPEGASGAAGAADAASQDPADAPVADAGTDEARRQLDEQRERYLRLAAEYDNFRKRATRERQEAGSRAQAELVKIFIDALDDVARFAHVDPTTVDAATVVQGVEMVEKKLLKGLGAAGLVIVDPLDQAFDPSQHEAVATEPALSPEDDHMVARVYQRGYVFGGQLLRPARVVVKQWNG